MNREIKFRGKRIDNGEWVYGSLVIDSMTGDTMSIIEWADMSETNKGGGAYVWMDVIPETVGQYIGIHDKTDKEIYEGDILLVNYGSAKLKEFVSFHCGAFKKSYNEKSDEVNRLPFTSLSSKNNEVIGNIHDNPELLK